MQLTIHRGSNQIGGTVVTIRTARTCIALDAGTSLEGDSEEDKSRLLGSLREAKDGIIITHSHPDHSGLAADIGDGIPVFMTVETSKILSASSLFAGGQRFDKISKEILPEGKTLNIGDITIRAFSVDHSVPGAIALLIEHEGIRLLYTGDLRFHGLRQKHIQKLINDLKGMLDYLMIEGTNLGSDRQDEPKTEAALHAEIATEIDKAPGLVLSHCSPQNLDRLKGFISGAGKTGRTFVADIYTAFIIYLMASQDNGLPKLYHADSNLRVWLNPSMWKKVCTNKGLAKFAESIEARQIALSAVTHDPSRYVIMFRPGMLRWGDWHEEMPCNPTLIYSSWRGYLEREPWKESWEIVHRMLEKTGGEVIQKHTSGHIAKTDWIALVKALSPKAIIPIHTESPEMYSTFFENVIQIPDNSPVQLT